MRFATPAFDATLNNGRGGYHCGHCGNADQWVDVGHHTGCAGCDTFLSTQDALLLDELDL